MKKLLITVCLCTLLLSGCKKEAKLANGEEAVVHINGKDFSANDLYKKLKASYGTSMLINMIDDYIVNVEITDQAEAIAYGKSKVTSEKSKFNSYSSVLGYTWEEYLRNNGFNSEDELAEYFKNNYLKEKVAIKYIIPSITDKEIKKYYKCLVYGIPSKKEDTLVGYLFKDSKKSMVYISNIPKAGYKKIITSYKVLESNIKDNTSTLQVVLEYSGRTHQIRAHLAHSGFPIIGDGKYGKNEINKKFNKKTQELTSYKLIFDFTSNSGILDYLEGKEIKF